MRNYKKIKKNKYYDCSECGKFTCRIPVNGPGPQNKKWVTFLLWVLTPFTQRKFYYAAIDHDIAYEQGGTEEERNAADEAYGKGCEAAANKSRFGFQRKYFDTMAEIHETAVEKGGKSSWNYVKCYNRK